MVLLTSTDPARQAEVFEAQKAVPARGGGRQLYQQMPQKSGKKEPSLSVQQQTGASPERDEVQSTSPKGFRSALDFFASYFALIDLNCTPLPWCVCHLKCFLPGSDIKLFLLTSSCIFCGEYTSWIGLQIHFTMGTAGQEK